MPTQMTRTTLVTRTTSATQVALATRTVLVALTGLVIALACSTSASASPLDRIGEKLADATLLDLDGKSVQLLDYQGEKALVIAYTGVGCPIAGRYGPRLEKLAKKYAKKGVAFVGINANPLDTAEQVRKDMAELGVTFPVFKDHQQSLTEQLDAKTTTEAFLIDAAGVIRYRGMIDDQYAIAAQRKNPKNKYLELAIKDVLKGRMPFTPRTAAPGCLITRIEKKKSVEQATYASHIAQIVQDNCQQCHRAGQVGPFPLTSYEQVRGWSAMIYSVIDEGRMPPWNAHPDFDGVFANERKIPDEDKKVLLGWIRDGMPRGNPDDDPPAKEWPKGWRIGKPDKVFTMKKNFRVPAEGVVPYKFFKVPTRFKEDKWIKAIEAKPGAADVVHHILAFLVEGDLADADLSGLGIRDGFLCANVPGDTPSVFAPGIAKKLPAGANLWLQMHYTTNGKKRKDKSSIGMIFADEPIEREVRTRGIANFTFEVPAGEADYEVRSEHTFKVDTEIFSLYPHMHFRGKNWKYIAHYPDGKEKLLLDVPVYDYSWQESYIFKTPIVMPKGSRLECIARYDNSEDNFVNPDPTVAVRFGEQSWEEMMIGYFDYIEQPEK